MTKQLAWAGIAVMTTLLALALLWQFRLVVAYVLLSLAMAAALRPLFKRPAGQVVAIRLAVILLYAITLVGFAFLLAAVVGAAIRDVQELVQQASAQDAWRQPAWLQRSSLSQLLDVRLPSPSQLFAALVGDQDVVVPAILGFAQGVFSLISGVLVALVLSVYWSVDRNRFERLWLSLLAPEQRKQMRNIWQAVEADLGIHIRHQAAQTLLAVLLLGIGYWLLGSPYPALLALMGALVLLIPLVGVILAVIPPLLIGLLTGVPLALSTAVYTLIVIVILKWWMESGPVPRATINPMLTLVILIALADAYGLLGIVVAPPLAAFCQILWSRLVSDRDDVGAATQVSELKERQVQVQSLIENMEEMPLLIASSMERLTALIEKAEPIVNEVTE
jgi:putative permease